MGKNNNQNNDYIPDIGVEDECSKAIQNENSYPVGLTPFLAESPYYQACADAFNHAATKYITPYKAAYTADYYKQPLSYTIDEGNPSFHEQVFGEQRESFKARNYNPYLAAFCSAQSNQPLPYYPGRPNPVFGEIGYANQEQENNTKEKESVNIVEPEETKANVKVYKKRFLVLLLVFVLAFACLAIPFISSLEILPDYVSINEDILAVDSIFEGSMGIETITDNASIIILALFVVFSLILTLKALVAIVSLKKCRFGLVAFIVILLGVGFVLTSNPDLISNFESEIKVIIEQYALLAMIGLPIIIFLISSLCYKRIKD